MRGVELVALRCPGCGQELQGGEVLLRCPSCGGFAELVGDDRLLSVDLHFRRLEEKGRGCYPFWVFDAGLQIRSRDSKRRIRSLLSLAPRGLSRLFEERGRLQLYCAAFGGDLEAGLSWSLHLTREQPELEETAPAAVQPVAFGRDDARRLADFVYLSSEIEAPDLVRSIDYELDLRDPQLLAVTL